MAVVGKSKDRTKPAFIKTCFCLLCIRKEARSLWNAYREEQPVIGCLNPFQAPAIKFTNGIILNKKLIMKLAPELIGCKTLYNKAAPISVNGSLMELLQCNTL